LLEAGEHGDQGNEGLKDSVLQLAVGAAQHGVEIRHCGSCLVPVRQRGTGRCTCM
jgi:hypothetical protein